MQRPWKCLESSCKLALPTFFEDKLRQQSDTHSGSMFCNLCVADFGLIINQRAYDVLGSHKSLWGRDVEA